MEGTVNVRGKKEPIELTPEDLRLAKKYLPKQQYATVIEYTQGEEGDHFKRIIKRISETAKANEGKHIEKNESGQTPLLFKYYLGDTRWYISEIDNDGTGFGYSVLNGDTQNSERGYVNLKEISEIEVPTNIHGYKLSPEMSFYEKDGETVERIVAEEFPELRAEMGFDEAKEKTVNEQKDAEIRLNYLTEREVEKLLGYGNTLRDVLQIDRIIEYTDFTDENGNKMTPEEAAAHIGREQFISGMGRASFHETACRNTEDGKTVEFNTRRSNGIAFLEDYDIAVEKEQTVKLIPQDEKEEPVSIEEDTNVEPTAGNTPHPTPITEENFESLNIKPGTIVHSIDDDTYWRVTADNGFMANMEIVNPDGTTPDITGNTGRSAFGHGLKQLLVDDVSQRYELPAREPHITYSIATTDEFNSEIIRKEIQTADAAVKSAVELINQKPYQEIYDLQDSEKTILEEKPFSEWTEEEYEQALENKILRGTDFENGKENILNFYYAHHTESNFRKTFAEELKRLYGEGGSSRDWSEAKGITIGEMPHYPSASKNNRTFSWTVIADKTIDLISREEYQKGMEKRWEQITRIMYEDLTEAATYEYLEALPGLINFEPFQMVALDQKPGYTGITNNEWKSMALNMAREFMEAYSENYQEHFDELGITPEEVKDLTANEERTEEPEKAQSQKTEEGRTESVFDTVTKRYDEKYKDFYENYETVKAKQIENDSRYVVNAKVRNAFLQAHTEMVKLRSEELKDIIRESKDLPEAKENALRFFNVFPEDDYNIGAYDNLWTITGTGYWDKGDFIYPKPELLETYIKDTYETLQNEKENTKTLHAEHLTSLQKSGIFEEKGEKITLSKEATNESTESGQGSVREGSDNKAILGRGSSENNAQGREGGESSTDMDEGRSLGGGHSGDRRRDPVQWNDRSEGNSDTIPPIHSSASDGRIPARPENGNGNGNGRNSDKNNAERGLADNLRESGSGTEQSRSGLKNVIFADYKQSRGEAVALREKVKQILEEHSDEEISQNSEWLQALANYEGGGGLKEQNATAAEIMNAFYTPRLISKAVWQLADFYAPGAVTVLEPSSGVGRFAENRPGNKFTLRELDKTSARIAKLLHPDANVIQGAFQEQFFDETGRVINRNYVTPKYDLVIGNPPYGDYNDFYKGLGEGANHSRYEEYFLEKGLDSLKDENSVLAFVIPSGFLRNQNSKTKEIIASKGTLIDAYRLPNKAFASTEIGTDIVILKKSTKDYKKELTAAMSDETDLKEAQEHFAIFNNDKWFKNHPEKVLGISATRSGRFGPEPCVNLPENVTLEEALSKVPQTLTKEILKIDNPLVTNEEIRDYIEGKLLTFGDINKVYNAEMTDIKESIKLHREENKIQEEPEEKEEQQKTQEAETTEIENPIIKQSYEELLVQNENPNLLNSDEFHETTKVYSQLKTEEIKKDLVSSDRFWKNRRSNWESEEHIKLWLDMNSRNAVIAIKADNPKPARWRQFATVNKFGEIDWGGIDWDMVKRAKQLTDPQLKRITEFTEEQAGEIKKFFDGYLGKDLRGNIYCMGNRELSDDLFFNEKYGWGGNKWRFIDSANGFQKINPPKIYSVMNGNWSDTNFYSLSKDTKIEPVYASKQLLTPNQKGEYDLFAIKEYSDSIIEKRPELLESWRKAVREQPKGYRYHSELRDTTEKMEEIYKEIFCKKEGYEKFDDFCDDLSKAVADRNTEIKRERDEIKAKKVERFLNDVFIKTLLQQNIETLKDFKEHKIEFKYGEKLYKGNINELRGSYTVTVTDDPKKADNTVILLDGEDRILGLDKKDRHITAYNDYNISAEGLKEICENWGVSPKDITVSAETYSEKKFNIQEILDQQIPSAKQIELAKNISEALLEAIKENDGTTEMNARYTGFSLSNKGSRTYVFISSQNNPAIEYDRKKDSVTFYQDAYEEKIIPLVEREIKPELQKTAQTSIYKRIEENGNYYVDLNGKTTHTSYVPRKYIPQKSELMSLEEFSDLYNKRCTPDEKAIWTATSWDGYINTKKLNDEQNKILRESENYVEETTGKYIHKEIFTSGNIYKKLDKLEKDLAEENITPERAKKNRKLLLDARPKIKPIENIALNPLENFTKTYMVTEKTNLQTAFLEWATHSNAEGSENTITSITNFAETPVSRNDIPVNITWADVYSYATSGEIASPVRSGKGSDLTEEEARTINCEKENSAKSVANTLLNRYIKEGLTPEQRVEMTSAYNKIYNANREPEYANLPLFIENANKWHNGKKWIYKEQQIKGASFLTYKRNGLLGYDVGVGKTATDILAVASQIQNGTAQRPVVIVPKSVYAKWCNDFQELFPNIPLIGMKNGGKEYTQQFADGKHGLSIPAGTVTVVTKEFLKNIGFKKNTIENELLEPAIEYLGAQKAWNSDKPRDKAEAEMKAYRLLGIMNKVEDSTFYFWENLGFDCINIDEAHFYKNAYADRSVKMFGIATYTQLHNDGCGMTLLTATPFPKATPQEVYSMLSYFCKNKLKELNIQDFSEFEKTFVNYENELAVGTHGNIEMKQVMKSYNKLDILQNIFNEYIDYKTAEEAGVIRPEREDRPIYLDPTESQKEWFKLAKQIMILAPAWDESAGADNKTSTARTLVGLNLMKQACLSPSTIELPKILDLWANQDPQTYAQIQIPEIPLANRIVEESPKLKYICDNIVKVWKKDHTLGQICYIPNGDKFYPEIINYMVKQGVPRAVFATITGEEETIGGKKVTITKNDIAEEKREKVCLSFNDINNPVKILLGTSAIREGVDLNGNTIATYNASIDWNPGDQTQLQGRAQRQGNNLYTTFYVLPLMNDSSDPIVYQLLDEKGHRANDLFRDPKFENQEIDPEEVKFKLITNPEQQAQMEIDKLVKAKQTQCSIVKNQIDEVNEILEKKKEQLEKIQNLKEEKAEYHYRFVGGESYRTPEEQKEGEERYDKRIEKAQRQAVVYDKNLKAHGIETEDGLEKYVEKQTEIVRRLEHEATDIANDIKLKKEKIKEFTEKKEAERIERLEKALTQPLAEYMLSKKKLFYLLEYKKINEKHELDKIKYKDNPEKLEKVEREFKFWSDDWHSKHDEKKEEQKNPQEVKKEQPITENPVIKLDGKHFTSIAEGAEVVHEFKVMAKETKELPKVNRAAKMGEKDTPDMFAFHDEQEQKKEIKEKQEKTIEKFNAMKREVGNKKTEEQTITLEEFENRVVERNKTLNREVKRIGQSFTIIISEKTKGLRIYFDTSKSIKYFKEIRDELKQNSWKYNGVEKTWSPISGYEKNVAFANRLLEKYDEKVREKVKSPYGGIVFFDRNYDEAKEFMQYYNSNRPVTSPVISEKDAAIILNGLGHYNFGLPSLRMERIGINSCGELVLMQNKNGIKKTEKTTIPGIIRRAIERTENEIKESERLGDSLFGSTKKTLKEQLSNIQKLKESIFKTTDVLKKGENIGVNSIEDIMILSPGVYQVSINNTKNGQKNNYFVIDEKTMEKMPEQIKDITTTFKEGLRIITNKLAEPYVLKSLIENKLLLPRDKNYYKSIVEYTNHYPMKYLSLYPIKCDNWISSLKKMSEISPELKNKPATLISTLVMLGAKTEQDKILKWMRKNGATNEKGTELLLKKIFYENKTQKEIENDFLKEPVATIREK